MTFGLVLISLLVLLLVLIGQPGERGALVRHRMLDR